jgi:hypothetical protein
MSDYEYYAGPEAQPVLDGDVLDLSAEDMNTIMSLVSTNPVAVRAAHVYDRKGFFCTDDFTRPGRNTSYGRDNDDIVVQVTILVRQESLDPAGPHAQLTDIHGRVQEAKAESDLRAAEEAHAAALAAKKAAVDAAEAEVVAARERLAQAKGEAQADNPRRRLGRR